MNKKRLPWERHTAQTRLYGLDVPIIGITGGIASGKSAVAEILKHHNQFVICADQIIKKIYNKASTLDFIQTHFPAAVDFNGKINFAILRQMAFTQPKTLESLEAFLYPQMKEIFLAEHAAASKHSVIFYDVPLLIEKQMHLVVDQSICVYAPLCLRKERIKKRDRISDEQIEMILKAQMPLEEKKLLCDHIIVNDQNGKEHMEKQVQELLKTLALPIP